ncbi:MAG: hypothetical protein Kow00128_21740 [Deltaproteobacteria bacterium]
MGLGGTGRMLALEISPKLVRVVEFAPGTRPLKIHRVAWTEWPGGEPVRVGHHLREFLEAKGFSAKKAVVSYLGPQIEHRIYPLPPAGPEARDALLRGKIAEEVSTPVSELRVTGEVVGKTVERGIERHEVLAVFTPEFEIRRLVFVLVEAGLSPVRVTSVPMALMGLVPEPGDEEVVGFLHACPSRAVICVAQGGKLRFAREFPVEFPAPPPPPAEIPEYHVVDLPGSGESGHDSPPSGAEEPVERMVTELSRSLLYYRQLSRGGSIQRLYWSGVPPPPRIVARIAERLKVGVEPHPALGLAALAEGIPGDAAEIAVPVGMGIAADDPDRVNLLPAEYLQRRKRWGTYAAVAAIAVAFLLANAGLYLGLNSAERRYREVLESTQSGANIHPAVERDFLHWMSLRRTVQEAVAGERLFGPPFTRWKALFAALGAPVPREMTFTSLELNQEAREYRARLAGTVRGGSPVEAQRRMNRFLAAATRSGMFAELEYDPVAIRPLGKEESPAGGTEQEFLLRFRLAEGGRER